MYPWFKYLHVLAVFGFLMAHGVSVGVAFTLRKDQSVDRIRMLLNMSAGAIGVADLSLLVLLITGIVAGFMGHHWGRGWIWVSLGLLIVLFGAMEFMAVRAFNKIRLEAGLPTTRGQNPAEKEPSPAKVVSKLAPSLPLTLTLIGFGGIAVITWLMIFKPF